MNRGGQGGLSCARRRRRAGDGVSRRLSRSLISA